MFVSTIIKRVCGKFVNCAQISFYIRYLTFYMYTYKTLNQSEIKNRFGWYSVIYYTIQFIQFSLTRRFYLGFCIF